MEKEELTEHATDAKHSEYGLANAGDPLAWSYTFKISTVVLVSLMTLIDTLATVTIIPAIPQILADFHSNNRIFSVALISFWEIGEGVGPLLVAPLSELYGRLPVYHTANIVFLLWSIVSALSTNASMLTAFRFLNGFSVASITLGPAIVGDMFPRQQRGTAMAILYASPLLGPVIGLVIGGFVTDSLGWRWTFWFIAIAVGVVQLLSFLLMRESHLKAAYQPRLQFQEESTMSIERFQFARAILRPLRFLFCSSTVLIVSVYTSTVYGYLYTILTTMTEMLEGNYGFTASTSGLSYIAIGIGMILGFILCGLVSDPYTKKQGSNARPEHRLLPMIVGSTVIPTGLFIYGWTGEKHELWILPMIGAALVGFGLMTSTIPAENYLVDAYLSHAASAIAGSSIFRSLVGAVFPLLGPPLYAKLGLGWGNSLLAFIAILFAAIPMLLLWYGHLLR